MAGSKTAETLLYNKFRREGYSVAEARRLAKLNAPYYERGRKNSGRRETRVEKRVRKALKKYVRRRKNPASVFYQLQSGMGGYLGGADTIHSASKRAQAIADQYNYPVDIYRVYRTESGDRRGPKVKRVSPKRGNPARVKGRKVKGGRAVTLRKFTGTIVRKKDGTVEILGRGRK